MTVDPEVLREGLAHTLEGTDLPELGEKLVFTLETPTDAQLGPATSLVALISDGDASPIATPAPL